MSECIEWHLSRGPSGYGKVSIKGRHLRAHRVAYCKANGLEIDDINGLIVRHKCDNRGCVNPDHLEVGTNQDNSNDMKSRKRQRFGERTYNSKLTDEIVREMRRRYVYRCKTNGTRALAREFGVRQCVVSTVIRRIAWVHVE